MIRVIRGSQKPGQFCSPRLDGHLALYRIRDEAVFVSAVVKLLKFLRRRSLLPAECHSRMKDHTQNGRLPRRILIEESNRLVLVALDDKPLLAREREEREHVGSSDSDAINRFLGIDKRRVAKISRRGGRPDLLPAGRSSRRGRGCTSRR